jgi:hypothetical protein
MQRSGLEWLFRLISEPRRLGRRYLIDNALFLLYTLQYLCGLRTGFATEGDAAAPGPRSGRYVPWPQAEQSKL